MKLFFTGLALAAAFMTAGFSRGAETPDAFNAGEMIMHHVKDAHEIHLITLHEGTAEEKHLAVPLPVILYTADRGIEVFSSSAFHNEHHRHDRYILHHEKVYMADERGELALDEHGHPLNEMPADFSITKTVVGIFLTVILMFLIFFSVAKAYTTRRGRAPKGLQSFMEPLILFVRDEIAKPSIGEKKCDRYLPFLLSVFFFIWIANLLGLIPFIGGFNVTGNITITMVLAVFTFIITTVSGNRAYWSHIFMPPGVPLWLYPILVPIEIMGMFTKPFVLMLRLFANITAGHIILLAFVSLIFVFGNLFGPAAGYGASLVSLAFTIFMNLIELLVAFLQAYVFTLLSALYFGMATEEAHH